MATVAADSIAMQAGRFDLAEVDPPMNDFTQCSLLTVRF